MPMLDMPLEELKTYMGKTPCPADFDEFWDRSLEQMYATDPKVEIKPYDLGSACCDAYELTFTAVDGARIYARMLKPKNITGKVPAVIEFHGHGGFSMYWEYLLIYASQGYVSVSMDCRGQGGCSEDISGPGSTFPTHFMRGIDGTPEQMYGRNLFLDTAMLARIIMELDYVDENRVATLGASQGGALAIACAALMPKIKVCAPNCPYMSDYKRVWEMDLDKDAYDGMRYYLRMFDPRHERIDEIFTKLGYIDIQNLAKRIRAKLLLATGLQDRICPPSTQFAAFNKMCCEKEMVIYPDFGHEDYFHHSTLVFKFITKNL